MEQRQEEKIKIYCDYSHFKGLTFEDNINEINNLLLGKSLKISNTQFIYTDEHEKKNYISANYFYIRMNTKDDKNNKEIKFFYPHNFIYSVFFYDNKLFYINKKNDLLIFELNKNKVKKNKFSQKNEKIENNQIGSDETIGTKEKIQINNIKNDDNKMIPNIDNYNKKKDKKISNNKIKGKKLKDDINKNVFQYEKVDDKYNTFFIEDDEYIKKIKELDNFEDYNLP